jgi:hypothetical protein
MKTKPFIQKFYLTAYGTLLLLIVALMGCGPVYQTDYIFRPPEDYNGRNCILQCDNMKMQCEQSAEMSYQDCEHRNAIEYDHCMRREKVYNKKGDCIENCYCSQDTWSCSRDFSRCDLNYRQCYRNCGGTVLEQNRCVSNCQ